MFNSEIIENINLQDEKRVTTWDTVQAPLFSSYFHRGNRILYSSLTMIDYFNLAILSFRGSSGVMQNPALPADTVPSPRQLGVIPAIEVHNI